MLYNLQVITVQDWASNI